MNCRELEAMLADYLGGELDEASRHAVVEHLDACEACRHEVGELTRTVSWMQRLDTLDPVQAAEATRGLRIVRTRPLAVRLAWTAMRAAAFIAIGLLLGQAIAPDQTGPHGGAAPVRVVEDSSREGDGMNPKWRDRAESLRTSRSSFARDLAIIAPAGPG